MASETEIITAAKYWKWMVMEFKRSLSKAAGSVAKLMYHTLATLLVKGVDGIINQPPDVTY